MLNTLLSVQPGVIPRVIGVQTGAEYRSLLACNESQIAADEALQKDRCVPPPFFPFNLRGFQLSRANDAGLDVII